MMANLFGKEKPQQLSQREVLASRYQGARHNLLLVVIFSLVNIFLLVTNSNTYFLFSATIPYFLVDMGMLLCGKYPEEYYLEFGGIDPVSDTFFIVMLVAAAVIILLYLLSWIFSKKPRVGWMIFALVFFVLDTVGMLCLTGITSDMIVDVVFHGWVIISLIGGVAAYFKAKKLPEEEDVPVVEAEQTPLEIEE